MSESIADEDQVLKIPKGCYVYMCDADSKNPTITVVEDETQEELRIKMPQALAYYLKTHSCASEMMRESLIEYGRRYTANAIKDN